MGIQYEHLVTPRVLRKLSKGFNPASPFNKLVSQGTVFRPESIDFSLPALQGAGFVLYTQTLLKLIIFSLPGMGYSSLPTSRELILEPLISSNR
ncbi:uncharacterized protein EAF02_005701 [Botrytis sinoallii]|uniref:uncharacterized protein n=1 Tax=Botrytis sinoallii TaxID=1463999 RepID=UPI0018FF2A22|nr:uncharacterized protein EAF02_005701 [Botrytis sinoallii]KAF7882338.1 hypothetical protein EAF02_005701 [Botrytis sinoallii]